MDVLLSRQRSGIDALASIRIYFVPPSICWLCRCPSIGSNTIIDPEKQGEDMRFDPLLAVVSFIFGILIIAFEDLLNLLVCSFFIFLGVWLLVGFMTQGDKNTPPEQGPPRSP
jgi:hypothetical protein